MRKPEPSRFIVLSPYDPREALTLKEAAARAGKSANTIKNWCRDHGIGRRLGGMWAVSKVALQMFIEGGWLALAAYHKQDWHDPVVKMYFERVGVPLEKTEDSTTFATFAKLAE